MLINKFLHPDSCMYPEELEYIRSYLMRHSKRILDNLRVMPQLSLAVPLSTEQQSPIRWSSDFKVHMVRVELRKRDRNTFYGVATQVMEGTSRRDTFGPSGGVQVVEWEVGEVKL